MKIILYAAILVWGIYSSGVSQQISSDIFPSEDELLDALSRGEIDSEQYSILLEIIQDGIDENNIHLLEQIPGLLFYSEAGIPVWSKLELEQLLALKKQSDIKQRSKRNFIYKYYQQITEDEKSRYRLQGDIELSPDWNLKYKIQKEYTGWERFVSRTLSYHPKNNFVKSIEIGSYNRRIGLGGMFGYRGKLLNYSEEIDDESFLYPDYGGMNGLFVIGQNKSNQVQLFSSFSQDTDFSIATHGGVLGYKHKRYAVQSGWLMTRLKNLSNKKEVNDYKGSLNLSYIHKKYRQLNEIVLQSGTGNSSVFLQEGQFGYDKHLLYYAFWTYGKQFNDLTSGSKTGSLYVRDSIYEVDFEYNNKRASQIGGFVKTRIKINDQYKFIVTVSHSLINSDTMITELLPAVVKDFNELFSVRFDFLYKYKKKSETDDEYISESYRNRLELYYQNKNIKLRQFFSFTNYPDNDDYLGMFLNVSYKTKKTKLEIWSNLSKLNLDNKTLDYWYNFLEHEFLILKNMHGVIKWSHTYNRNSSQRYLITLSSELRVSL